MAWNSVKRFTNNRVEITHQGVLVHRLAYNSDVVAFKMGRRQGARRAHPDGALALWFAPTVFGGSIGLSQISV
jgi:hypothetical protein